uniref:Uncharacterized protein n=1 Tax=viral metagenome TaxID=1070528 RepID=A0A6C0ESG7_9ZZZZ
MAIHRFKCSESLNKEIMEFSEIHKFDTKDNLIEQFDSWTISKKELIDKESMFLENNDYDTDINVKIFKSIKYYYIKKFLKNEKREKKEKKKPTMLSFTIRKNIQDDLDSNFEKNRSFKPADSYKLFIETNKIEDNAYIKKCYKNHYYQIKNKKYYNE